MTSPESWVGGAPSPDMDIRTTLCIGGVYHMVRFCTANGGDFVQGKPVEVSMEFFAADLALPKFQPGVQFTIWAGKDVGIGEVLSNQGTSNTSLERTRDR
jgi:hypothetical protein